MLEKPPLDDDQLIARARASYGVDIESLTFLPVGNDSHSWVYRAALSGGSTLLLKVRGGVLREESLLVPHMLYTRGQRQIVAPLPASDGTLSLSMEGGFALMLYPFIDGQNCWRSGLTGNQWEELGTIARQFHDAAIPDMLAQIVRGGTFVPGWWDIAIRLHARFTSERFTEPIERAFAEFWNSRRTEIQRLFDGAAALGKRLQAAHIPLVICHADLHLGNILRDDEEQLWIVDWDEVVLAPRERDLMYVVEGGFANLVSPQAEAHFLRGYGPIHIDTLALAYYRYARAVEDVGGYGEALFVLEERGKPGRQQALEGFMAVFEPGDLVDQALRLQLPTDDRFSSISENPS